MASQTGYRVLARKYRPQSFRDLIGQDALVQTLTNAFASGRIAQAYMLTGVRGVGKTTTARILARALNYSGVEGAVGPSLEMPRLGEHCEAIMESRHIDVLEMDAASHTGIADIREIIESVRYKPVAARYKVTIIDEVHMLSTAAFNGLLKTLEEPPEHAKFIFATTEIRKVPVTVLSRCQRFDLRRVDAEELVSHLRGIAQKEEVQADDEALAVIARASEGSVRDALSLLDQAVAHGGGRVEAEDVRAMLGLADRGRILDLFEHVMRGDVAASLAELKHHYDSGADPALVLTDLAQVVHLVTRLKLVPASERDGGLSQAERMRGQDFAKALSIRVLSRAWQMLLKGIAEVQGAGRPLAAAEMVLVRLAHAADLPTPDEALRMMRNGEAPPARPARVETPPLPEARTPDAPAAPPAVPSDPELAAIIGAKTEPKNNVARPAPSSSGPREEAALETVEDVAALAQSRRNLAVKFQIERFVRPVRLVPGEWEIALAEGAPPTLTADLARVLGEWTGRRWTVTQSREAGGPTLAEQRTAKESLVMAEVEADPAVAAVLERFPGASILGISQMPVPTPAEEADAAAEALPEPAGDGEGGWSFEPDEQRDED